MGFPKFFFHLVGLGPEILCSSKNFSDPPHVFRAILRAPNFSVFFNPKTGPKTGKTSFLAYFRGITRARWLEFRGSKLIMGLLTYSDHFDTTGVLQAQKNFSFFFPQKFSG